MISVNGASVYAKVISIVVGVMFLVGGLIFFFKYDPAAYNMQATGTIVDIEENINTGNDDGTTTYTAYIDYRAGGKTFKHIEYFEYNSSMKIGDKVHFYYMSTDPSQIAGSNKESAPYIGLVFAVAGVGMLVVTGIKIMRKR